MTKAYFCTKTGVRLVAPGVSKAVDPEKGVDEFSESAPASGVSKALVSEPQPKDSGAKSSSKKASE